MNGGRKERRKGRVNKEEGRKEGRKKSEHEVNICSHSCVGK
jgi:hypothetical protein